MPAYIPDATALTEPSDIGISAATAAAEFRAIKSYMSATLLAGINSLIASVATKADSAALALKAPLISPSFTTPALGTPTAGDLSNCTALPFASISGMDVNAAAFIVTPSSLNLRTALTDNTGTGLTVFGTTPTLTTPVLNNPAITDFFETTSKPAAAAAFTVNLSNGTKQHLTTSANCTITLPAAAAGKCYTIRVEYGGVHTLTWAGGTAIKWSSGVAPTPTSVAGKCDTFTFDCDDTLVTYGVSGGSNA